MTYKFDFEDIFDVINNIALIGSEEDWIKSDDKEEIESKLNSVVHDMVLEPDLEIEISEEINSYFENNIEGSDPEEVRKRIEDELGDLQEEYEIDNRELVKEIVIKSIYNWLTSDEKESLENLIKENMKVDGYRY